MTTPTTPSSSATHPLAQLGDEGVSVWLDDLSRELLGSGELQRLVEDRGGRRIYQFANGGYVYRVLASVDPAKGGGGVQVWRDGRMLLAEPFAAYTAAS